MGMLINTGNLTVFLLVSNRTLIWSRRGIMYKKVLFATDFDDVGVSAAHKAKKIADENHAELFLVHVVEPIPAYAYPGFAGFAEVEQSIREQAEKELDSWV